MSLNPQYMIAPSLQENFVDKTTLVPLSGGTVTYYSDNNRATLKPIYTLSGSPPNYTYVQLPNPVTLSAAGSIQDNSGNDVLPYYYPYDADGNLELYYIVVKDSGGTLQFTRQAYPNLVTGSGSSAFVYNYVRNPQFYCWSTSPTFLNVGGGSISNTDYLPDDWVYSQNDTTQNISISRQTFTLGDTSVPGNPTYFFRYQCLGIGSAAQVVNCLQQYYNSVQTLNGQTVSVSLQLRGTVNLPITVELWQYFGSGGSPSTTVKTNIINLTTVGSNLNFNLYTGTVTLPSITGKTLGTNGDDVVGIVINFPLNQVATFDIANVQLQQSTSSSNFVVQSNNDWQKETDYTGLYSEFRTGDVKFTLRAVADTGWLLMDDTTIGNNYSNATHQGNGNKALFFTIWNNVFSTTWAPIYTSGGVLTTYGANAEADWNANKQLSLTKVLGRALATAGSGSGLTTRALGETTGAETKSLSSAENGPHIHTATTVTSNSFAGSVKAGASGSATDTIANAGGGGNQYTTSTPTSTTTIVSSGSGTAFSLYQPTSFMNVMIKL